MGQEYPPEKDTKHSAPAPLRRRLHEFYFGGGLLCRSSSRKQTSPDLSFRTPPRGATACRENVLLLLANTLASVSQLCRTRIIERGKIIPRKSLQPNNLQKNNCRRPSHPRGIRMPSQEDLKKLTACQGKIPRRAVGRRGIPYEEGMCPVIRFRK